MARGQLDYLVPGLLGFLTGGVLFGLVYRTEWVQWLLTTGRPELAYAKLPEILGVDPLLMAFVFSEGILLFLYFLGRSRIKRNDPFEPIVEQERIAAGLEDSPAAGD